MKLASIALLGAMIAPTALFAAVLDFEGVTTASINVSPAAPYSEKGFTLTPLNTDSAVFASAMHLNTAITTAAFGFSGTNAITLTAAGGAPFSVQFFVATVFEYGTPATSATLTATWNFAAGGFGGQTFALDLDAATVTLNLTGLSSLVLQSTTDTLFDTVSVQVADVPLPAAGLLLPAALLGFGALRRRRA